MLNTLSKSIVIKLLSRTAQCKYVCGESWTMQTCLYQCVAVLMFYTCIIRYASTLYQGLTRKSGNHILRTLKHTLKFALFENNQLKCISNTTNNSAVILMH